MLLQYNTQAFTHRKIYYQTQSRTYWMCIVQQSMLTSLQGI
uniref:Uncharacterized protein n=1 Tax=Anguilla anguilla TaxID=7936 RepID=A0A0E9UBJ9_ANGAN